MKLYETLENLLHPSPYYGMNGVEMFSDKAKEFIESETRRRVERKLGSNGLSKLESYIDQNISSNEMKSLLEKSHRLTYLSLWGSMSSVLDMEASAATAVLLGTHHYLEKNSYDLTKAWNEIRYVISSSAMEDIARNDCRR